MNPDTSNPFAEAPPPPPPPRLPDPARRAAPSRAPSAFASINWDDLRVKAWQISLMVASAYVVSHPEKWGWLAPVLTGSAGMSRSPTMKPTTTASAIAATVGLTLGWRVWLA